MRLTAEPTRGPVGVLLRAALGRGLLESGQPLELDWAVLALLFAADRLDHHRSVIEPALREGAWVISDRYDLSSLVYQSVTSTEGPESVEWIRAINRRARRPDLTIVIDVLPEVAERRRAARGAAPELFEKSELQRSLAGVYARAEELVPGDRLVHVPGDGSPEEVLGAIVEVVLRQAPAAPLPETLGP